MVWLVLVQILRAVAVQPPSISSVITHPVIRAIVFLNLVRNSPRVRNGEKADNGKLFFGDEKDARSGRHDKDSGCISFRICFLIPGLPDDFTVDFDKANIEQPGFQADARFAFTFAFAVGEHIDV